MEDFRSRLKYLMRIFGFSQKEFAEKLGISTQSLYSYIKEKNPSTPLMDIQIAIHNFGINYMWLLTGEGDKFADNINGDDLRYQFSVIVGTSPPPPPTDRKPEPPVNNRTISNLDYDLLKRDLTELINEVIDKRFSELFPERVLTTETKKKIRQK